MKARYQDREPVIYDGQHTTDPEEAIVADRPEYAGIVGGIWEAGLWTKDDSNTVSEPR
jgi:hypothetical protein